MEETQPRFLTLAVKTVICHTLTYFVMGALAYHFLHYADVMNKPNSGLRPATDPLIMFGTALQVVRGVLFATVFYPFREILFGRKNGWLLMAWMLIGLGILGTFAAPPGSLQGFIFTMTPAASQLRGYLEVVPQALLLSALLFYWVRHPEKVGKLGAGGGVRNLPFPSRAWDDGDEEVATWWDQAATRASTVIVAARAAQGGRIHEDFRVPGVGRRMRRRPADLSREILPAKKFR